MTHADIAMVELGHIVRGAPRQLTLARTLAFSGGPFDASNWPARNLHTDLEIANQTGLSKVVASGTQFEGYLATHLTRIFGTHWYSAGAWDVKIVRSVQVGDTVTPVAKLLSRELKEEGVAVEVEVWCENQDAQNVLTGTATCVVPRRTDAKHQ